MEAWLSIVVRQLILYSLPVILSLSMIGWLESRILRRSTPPFHAIAWRGAWLPLLAAIAFHRGIIIALPKPADDGVRAALIRLTGHACLCLIGWLLYSWSLAHPMSAGLPPLHHWWSKVLMFFNLCMLGMHLLPLRGMLVGEWLQQRNPGPLSSAWFEEKRHILIVALLAASPLLDLLLGGWLLFPVYEFLSSQAAVVAN